MRKPAKDPAVRRFIRQSPAPETFTHLAAELRRRFGLDLTPEAASHLWREIRMPRPGRVAQYERNQALMAFIRDRADLMTLDELLNKISQVFGEHMKPSRSQLSRMVHRLRDQARVTYGREVAEP